MGKTFELGRTVITKNADGRLSNVDIMIALNRHRHCDWGDMCQEDKQTNDDALKYCDRILSAYSDSKGTKFWIITEADRSVTTILLPEDY